MSAPDWPRNIRCPWSFSFSPPQSLTVISASANLIRSKGYTLKYTKYVLDTFSKKNKNLLLYLQHSINQNFFVRVCAGLPKSNGTNNEKTPPTSLKYYRCFVLIQYIPAFLFFQLFFFPSFQSFSFLETTAPPY